MAQRWQEAQRNDEWNSYDECITGLLDVALAFRQTVECPECGGTGEVFCADDDVFPDACGCIDGRVPGETRLAIVEVVGSNVPGTVICRFLAPDLPEGTQP